MNESRVERGRGSKVVREAEGEGEMVRTVAS